jgi:hypothetical protein
MPTLVEQMSDYVNAAFAGIWIRTSEPNEAEREIVRHGRDKGWTVASWDIAQGLRIPGKGAAEASEDPLAALRALPALAQPNGTILLLLHNYHRFLQSPEAIQTMFGSILAGKVRRTFVVVLAPVVQIPQELEKLFVVLEHALPSWDELHEIAKQLQDGQCSLPTGLELVRVLEAASGLNRYEAEGAFALSLTRHDRLHPDAIWELKAQTVRKNNVLSLHRGGDRFERLGGLGQLKDFSRRALAGRKANVRPRGMLLLGVPGTGKSAFCKALGNETGRPTLILDVGTLLGSLVGQSEGNLRQALRIADAMAPCILMVDEIEKALSGVGGAGDSGVSTRMFGTLLTWLSDHESDVCFVGTSNDISKLPPEFCRAERFDGVFFLDLPSTEERAAIWSVHRHQFGIPERDPQPDDAQWTGAEIRSCCRLAALLDLPLVEAARNVVPVAVTAAEQVERLRSWAKGRCLSAGSPGIFGQNACSTPEARRSLKHIEPTSN